MPSSITATYEQVILWGSPAQIAAGGGQMRLVPQGTTSLTLTAANGDYDSATTYDWQVALIDSYGDYSTTTASIAGSSYEFTTP